MSKKKNKNKKEKVVYYDDGSTVSDMSKVGGIYGRKIGSSGDNERENRYYKPRSSFSDKAKTYFEAVKLMIKPMLIVLIAISVVFLILFLISSLR